MGYSKYRSSRYGKSIKSKIFGFFIKWSIMLAAIVGLGAWFLYSSFGDSIDIVKDYKAHVRNNITEYKTAKANAIDSSVRASLGIPTRNAPGASNPTFSKPETEVNAPISTSPEPTAKAPTPSSDQPQAKLELSEEAKALPALDMEFYYDNTNAPTDLVKSLDIIAKASAKWTYACNIRFVFKGEKHADYVSTANTLHGDKGIVKWATQMNGDTIGEAHMGSEHGPVKNFVMELNSEYFKGNKEQDLILTTTHEMGHVIGLDHSNNSKSIMYFQSGGKQTLQSSDQAMCLYLRARWSGMSQSQAAAKYNLVF